MNFPNQITVLRILLVPVFICLLLYYHPERAWLYGAAVIVFLVACLTDALDGYLARRLNQRSDFGRVVDPIADKLLLLSAFISLSFMHNLPLGAHMPAWVTVGVIARDVLILIGSIVIYLLKGELKADPTRSGKLTTFAQMTAVVACFFLLPFPVRAFFILLAFGLTLYSGFTYIRIGSKILSS